MTIFKKDFHSLADSFKYRPVMAVLFTAACVIISISAFKFIDYFNRAEVAKAQVLSKHKNTVEQVVLNTTSYINHLRLGSDNRLRTRVQSRVNEAHATATSIYNKLSGERPDAEIKKIIIAALRPLQFFGDRGHYFIISLDGTLQLQPKKPELEGTNRLNFKNTGGRYIVKELWDIVDQSGEGFLSYEYNLTQDKSQNDVKTTFVKYFEPFGWLIGAGDYLVNIENEIQKEALEYIKQVSYGENSYIFVVSYTGTVVMNVSQPHLIGKNIWNLEDPNGVKVIQEERRAVENKDGDFIYYVWNKPTTSTPAEKISFMKGIEDWQWMVGAGLYVDEVTLKSEQVVNELKQELAFQILIIVLITALSSLLIVFMSNRMSSKFSFEINQFIKFFIASKEKLIKMDVGILNYSELSQLAVSANQMVDAQNEMDKKRVEVEQKLLASEHNLKEAQRITHLGSWEYDLIAEKLTWSDEVYQIFGINNEEVELSFEIFLAAIHPDDKALVQSSYENSVKNKSSYNAEHRICLKDNVIKTVREFGETLYDEAGLPLKTVGTIQDITELNEKEKQLRRAQKMDAIGQLTGGIAHDFNNILGIIMGNLDMLKYEIVGHEKAMNRVNTVYKAAQRAADLTKQLLSFSRNQDEKAVLIDINQKIVNMDSLITRSITPEVEFEMKLFKNLWEVEANPGEFEDALLNMILNARDAMPTGGRLIIETSNSKLDDAYCVQHAAVTAGEYILLTISDTGVGISSEGLTRIFDPFYTTKPIGKGTGLGLSMVFGFIKRVKGHIQVYSEIDIGTTFNLYFPRVKTQNKDLVLEDTPNKYPEILPRGKETILAVDDEAGLLMLAKESLQALGYQVLTASNGTQALEILHKNTSISLLFSDVVMPGGMNGYELAEQATKEDSNLKVLLTSGYTKTTLAHNGQARFNVNLLNKPYAQADLALKVRSLLDELKS